MISTYKNGFTLVETLVAVSILMLAILGPLAIASAGLRNSLNARDQITAYYLAQEGIEYVRYMRDYNYLNSNGWLDGLEDCMVSAGGCVLDTPEWFSNSNPNASAVSRCTGTGCANKKTLYLDSDGLYTHVSTGGNTPSRYSRVITLTPPSGNATTKEVTITSVVTWQTPSGEKTTTSKEQIFNTYNNN